MASEPIIRLRGVTKVYGTGPTAFQALKGVDLDIEQSDFVAVMGPSGSGKSTTMNILGCLDVPTEGEFLRSEEHTSELQSLMRISYAVFCLNKKNQKQQELVTSNTTHKRQTSIT